MLVHWRVWKRSWLYNVFVYCLLLCECVVCLVQNILGSVLSSKPFRSQRGPPASQKEHRTAETKGLSGWASSGEVRGARWLARHVEETCSPKVFRYVHETWMFPIFQGISTAKPWHIEAANLLLQSAENGDLRKVRRARFWADGHPCSWGFTVYI